MAAGGSEVRCNRVFDSVLKECLPRCGGIRPPSLPAARTSAWKRCEEARGCLCARWWNAGGMPRQGRGVPEAVPRRVRASATAPVRRAILAKKVLEECVSQCPPRPGPCETRRAMRTRAEFAECLQRSEEEICACVEAGGDPETCREEACAGCKESLNGFFARCLEACKDDPPPPEPSTCPERCRSAAQKVRDECLAAGGSPEACAAAVEEFLKKCLTACEQPPPDPCEMRLRVRRPRDPRAVHRGRYRRGRVRCQGGCVPRALQGACDRALRRGAARALVNPARLPAQGRRTRTRVSTSRTA